MAVIADLHLHSRFARAVSHEATIANLAAWGKKKGIGLLAAPDFTHPLWLAEMKAVLKDNDSGLFSCKADPTGPQFILSSEVSLIYSDKGKLRRIHLLLYAPNFATVDKIVGSLIRRGANLLADGRPVLGLTSYQVAAIVTEASGQAFIIPAHAWTPHFGVLGLASGYDSLEDCFGDLTDTIPAIETGLSSDPAMNWRVGFLDSKAIVSFSDAHSLPKLGREATVFKKIDSYDDFYQSLADPNGIVETLEFFPEEGKYHFAGHSACKVKRSPEELKQMGSTCSVCGKALTMGVANRVEMLATRPSGEKPPGRPGFRSLVPLQEIIADVFGVSATSKRVQETYQSMLANLGPEFPILLDLPIPDIQKKTDARIAQAIANVREGKVTIDPGFDGEFGKVSVFDHTPKPDTGQQSLF